MIFFVIILLIIVLGSAKIAGAGTFSGDYMSRERTNAIKGIFVLLVLIGHSTMYIKPSGVWDQLYMDMRSYLNQMVVSVFFFYSGYGMMKSILKNKFEYVRRIPIKRFLIVFLNFNISVVLFLILQFCFGKTFDIPTILLSAVGWLSVGNSNWYMFAVFGLYILMFVSFYLLRWLENRAACVISAVIFTGLSVLFVYWQIRMGQPIWCYNTIMLFPLGLWYAILQKPLESILMKNDYLYAMFGAALAVLYWIGFRHRWDNGIWTFTIWAVLFTLLVIFITMKVSVHSRFIIWFGEHVFSVYILQRIPMMLLSKLGVAAKDRYAFIILSFVLTVFISLVFDYFTGKLDRAILKKLKLAQ